MKTLAVYIASVILIIGISWFGWWSLLTNELTTTYKLGDLFVLWRKFNEGFMAAAGVGAVFLLLMAVYPTKNEANKAESVEVEK